MKNQKFILWFKEIGKSDVPLVGGKNASLGEMFQNLAKHGVKVPNGFAITTAAYRYFVKHNNIEKKLKEILKGLDTSNITDLQICGKKVRELFLNSVFPEDLASEITNAYKKLGSLLKLKNPDTAVRSSATAEDLPDASFAGQQETYLNISGAESVILHAKKAFASLFTDRAISYRQEKGFDHFRVALSVTVQKMVRSDLASSGVIFTCDTESGFDNVIYITGSWGLGEMVVQGQVSPDQFYVFEPSFSIIEKKLGIKDKKLVYDTKKSVKEVSVPKQDRKKYILNDNEILKLATWAVAIEKHYKKKMDIEWAKDGQTDELYIVQARPETIHNIKEKNILETYTIDYELKKGRLLLQGQSVGSKIGRGIVHVIKSASEISKFKPGEVLVTDMTNPDWEPIMKVAQAIITNKGGKTCFSGDTKLLTNKGFVSFEDVVANWKKEKYQVLSLNKDTLRLEWKPVIDGMIRDFELTEVKISQTGRMNGNVLWVTADHTFPIFKNRKLIDKKLNELLENDDMILSTNKIEISGIEAVGQLGNELAYILGAISSDGHIHLTNRHGAVYFVQKESLEKKFFIERVQEYFEKVFEYKLKHRLKKSKGGIIRGQVVKETISGVWVCYSKIIADELLNIQKQLDALLLTAPESVLYNFLAGIIDGDGTFNKESNRINIYCSKEFLLKSIVIACLRLGIDIQVTNNRNIGNIQFVNNFERIFDYTARVYGHCVIQRSRGRLLSARGLLADIQNRVNYLGRITSYIQNNCLIDPQKIFNNLIPMIRGEQENHELTDIVNSSLSNLRVSSSGRSKKDKVYNITVADNHNYLVFTSRYTPIIANNCHAAIISRELGVPCVIGTCNATTVLKTGMEITIDCSTGTGDVYEGLLDYRIEKLNLNKLPKTKTKIMINIGIPERAFTQAQIPSDGVGLAREEFIINSHIGIHPMALINYNKLLASSDPHMRKIAKVIDERTEGYVDKTEFFIERLSYGIARIAAAFYPKDVIVRLSDFKSNEYANLIGGKLYEPHEDNPMIGWRGASRYYDLKYRAAFELECKALLRVREEMKLSNVIVMVPFCRTPEEGRRVLETMKEFGLEQGKNGLQVYMMVEVPSNIVLIEEFVKIFDGFSIGSNDLTQLTLGLDRDSEIVAHLFDERNLAIKKSIARAIDVCKGAHKKIGICGQAPSDFPDFARFLVECGITSISLNPDTVIKTRMEIAEEEKRIRR